MTELKVTRIKEWANRRHRYKIIIDGVESFEISNGQQTTVKVGERSTLQAKLNWFGSKKIDLQTKSGAREVVISSNKAMTIVLPVIAFAVLAAGSAVSFVSGDPGTKTVVNILLAVMIFVVLCQALISRSRFLNIEVIGE